MSVELGTCHELELLVERTGEGGGGGVGEGEWGSGGGKERGIENIFH